jgi:ketosteroid isomerase-like protein
VSGEDLEVMRASVEAWNRIDLDHFIGTYAADAEVLPDPNGPDTGPYRGRAAIRKFFEGLREEWERDEVVLTELIAVGDTVLAQLRWRTRGAASGIETEVSVTSVSSVDGGKITWQRFYFDHDEALRAVGLEE